MEEILKKLKLIQAQNKELIETAAINSCEVINKRQACILLGQCEKFLAKEVQKGRLEVYRYNEKGKLYFQKQDILNLQAELLKINLNNGQEARKISA